MAPTRRYVPAPVTRVRVSRRRIPRGYSGTKQTVNHIKQLIKDGASDFYVRQKAIDILLDRGVPPKDYLGEIKALFDWVQANVRYTKDPYRVETLHTARRMLELRAGDCDDLSILLGAMLEAIGHPVRLVITGPDPLRPRFFSHVYLEVQHQGRWIPLDPTANQPIGFAPRVWAKEVIPIERRSDMAGCGCQSGSRLGQAESAALGLVRAVKRQGIRPLDGRVLEVWGQLYQRGILQRRPWVQRLLRQMWTRGLDTKPRPKSARRLARILRAAGLLPRRRSRPKRLTRVVRIRPLTPAVVRPLPRRPVRPVRRPPVRAAAARAGRR